MQSQLGKSNLEKFKTDSDTEQPDSIGRILEGLAVTRTQAKTYTCIHIHTLKHSHVYLYFLDFQQITSLSQQKVLPILG